MDHMDLINRLEAVHAKFETVTTVEERHAVEAEWWATAIGAFDEHVAGTITLADGHTMEIPTIQI